MTSSVRRIFNYNNLNESKVIISLDDKSKLYEKSISACGCLFYKKTEDGKIKLLLISYTDPSWPKLDDFGGRIDESDMSVFDTIKRETYEETNKVIDNGIMDKFLISGRFEPFYNLQSKYYVIVIEVDNNFFPNTEIFGDFEETDKIKRIVKWYDYDDVKDKLAFRLLKNNDLIKYLNKKLKK